MGLLHGANRHAASLCPERLDASSAAAHPVRFLDAFVDPLHLPTRGLPRATPAATGRPASAPAALLQLDMSGALYPVRSRRRLAQATHRHVEWRWLFTQRRPAHKTRADCRTHPLGALRQVCRAWTWLGQQLALVAGALGAIDGSQVQAGNATARHGPPDKLPPRLQQSDQRVAGSLEAWESQEKPEEAGPPDGAVAAHGQAKREALPHRQHLAAGLPTP